LSLSRRAIFISASTSAGPDINATLGPGQCSGIRIKTDEAPGMAALARTMQHGAGPTADVQDRARGHDEFVIEAIAGPALRIPRVQQVIQRGGISV
jgi:hypothetical protein